jgi:replication-associated recombination protein RarA
MTVPAHDLDLEADLTGERAHLDELVRAELDESICVQGAPGTGKTDPGL